MDQPPDTVGGGGIYYSYTIGSSDVHLDQSPITDSPVRTRTNSSIWRILGDRVSSTSSIFSHERVEYVLSETQHATTPSTVRITVMWIRRNWFIATLSALIVILIGVVIVAGLCGDGNCSGKGPRKSRSTKMPMGGSADGTNAPTSMPQTNIVVSPVDVPSSQPIITLGPAVENPTDFPGPAMNYPTFSPSTEPSTQGAALAPFNLPASPPSAQRSPQPSSDSLTISPSTEPSPSSPSKASTNIPSLRPNVEPTTKNSSPAPFQLPTSSPTKTSTTSPSCPPSTGPIHNPTIPPFVDPPSFYTYLPSFPPSVDPSVVVTQNPTPAPASSNPVEPPIAVPTVTAQPTVTHSSTLNPRPSTAPSTPQTT